MVLNKLSKAERGKSNKAYVNAASFSKMPTFMEKTETSLCGVVLVRL